MAAKMNTGHMRYVICPKCGDAVAGRLPSGDEPRKLKCVHCSETFTFADSEVKSGLVSYDESSHRWTVAKS
jgi:phage baseplate assembly protein gpV